MSNNSGSVPLMELRSDFKAMLAALAALEPRVDGLADALECTEPSVSVRFNRSKLSGDIPSDVAGVPVSDPVPWCAAARYLESRPVFTLDPALHQGLYYVQDASSMFIDHVVRHLTRDVTGSLAYLDACAAPGGKTTAAMDALPAGSLVVANEWDYRRAAILRENVIKWGYPAAVVSRGDTARYSRLAGTFDIIAADVPCSGEGMMRKDADAVAQWSPVLVGQCADRQREIIANLWPALKPGGYLIYSTCTFNRSENEEIVDWIIREYDATAIAIPVEPSWGILPGIGTDVPCYRFMPHRLRGEGLFMAVLRKDGDRSMAAARRDKARDAHRSRPVVKLPDWLPGGLEPRQDGDTLYGIDSRWQETVGRIVKAADVIMPGIEIGEVKGRDLIPSQGVAMSTALDCDRVPTAAVDRDTALAYLRRDAVTLDGGDHPRGHLLLTHGGHPLGWVKNLGNRTNNLYPTPWRILMKQ